MLQTHHCNTKMLQSTNDRELSSIYHNNKNGSAESMTNLSIQTLNKVNNNIQFKGSQLDAFSP